jgi:hypothetical protein
VSKYIGTGRELATTRSNFPNVYKRYVLSHLSPALDLFVLIFIFFQYSTQSVSDRFGMSIAPLLVAFSWMMAPAIYNPFGFSLDALLEDWRQWSLWISSPDFLDNLYGQKSGARTGDFLNSNWFFWFNCFSPARRLGTSLINLVMWLCLFFTILLQIIQFDANAQGSLLASVDEGALVIVGAIVFLFVVQVKEGVLQVRAHCAHHRCPPANKSLHARPHPSA